MAIQCGKCGNTNHPPGAQICAVCGATLPAPIVRPTPKAVLPAASLPVLATLSGRRYRLNPNGETLIGSKGCAVTLSEPGVSAQHARVVPSGNGFAVEDLGGGTKVNGKQIRVPHSLQPGDIVEVGKTSLVYQGPTTARDEPQPQPSPAAVRVLGPAITPALPWKDWGRRPPMTEGEVTWIDGPYQVEKGKAEGYKIRSVLDVLLIPRGQRGTVPVRFLRITDFHTGQDVSVVMGGHPKSPPRLGDIIAVWGRRKEGYVIMKMGYNYTTDSKIRLKR